VEWWGRGRLNFTLSRDMNSYKETQEKKEQRKGIKEI
jgi:hypothetical protein